MKESKIIEFQQRTDKNIQAVFDSFTGLEAKVEGKVAQARVHIRDLFVWTQAIEAILSEMSEAIDAAKRRRWSLRGIILRWLFSGMDLSINRERIKIARTAIAATLAEVEKQQAAERARKVEAAAAEAAAAEQAKKDGDGEKVAEAAPETSTPAVEAASSEPATAAA